MLGSGGVFFQVDGGIWTRVEDVDLLGWLVKGGGRWFPSGSSREKMNKAADRLSRRSFAASAAR